MEQNEQWSGQSKHMNDMFIKFSPPTDLSFFICVSQSLGICPRILSETRERF